MNFIKPYLVTLFVFLSIDMIWLGLVAKNFYSSQIGHLMTPNVNWLAAVVFYLLFAAGLLIFVISPSQNQPILQLALLGGFFGLISYSTYDLTNLATLKDWSLVVTIVDLIWGTVLSATVSVVAKLIISKFGL